MFSPSIECCNIAVRESPGEEQITETKFSLNRTLAFVSSSSRRNRSSNSSSNSNSNSSSRSSSSKIIFLENKT